MKSAVNFAILGAFTAILGYLVSPSPASAWQQRLGQAITQQDQKQMDLLPDSIYLYPQAFSTKSDKIEVFQLRVCVEFEEPLGASLSRISGSEDSRRAVPWGDGGIVYNSLSQPGVCRKYKTVNVPTSEKVLEAIDFFTKTFNRLTYDELSKIDTDLDRRIGALMISEAVERAKSELKEQVKQELLNGPLVEELAQRIHNEIKAKESLRGY